MMKKLLCFLLLLPISFVCMAQEVEIRVHEVQRGESLEHGAEQDSLSMNPRGVYKLIDFVGRGGETFKAMEEQYKICTDSMTLTLNVEGDKFDFSLRNGDGIFDYTGEEPDVYEPHAPRIYDSNAQRFFFKWWSEGYVDRPFFPTKDWCVEHYEAGQFSEAGKAIIDAFMSPDYRDGSNPLIGVWCSLGTVKNIQEAEEVKRLLDAPQKKTASYSVLTPSKLLNIVARKGQIIPVRVINKDSLQMGSSMRKVTWLSPDTIAIALQQGYVVWARAIGEKVLIEDMVSPKLLYHALFTRYAQQNREWLELVAMEKNVLTEKCAEYIRSKKWHGLYIGTNLSKDLASAYVQKEYLGNMVQTFERHTILNNHDLRTLTTMYNMPQAQKASVHLTQVKGNIEEEMMKVFDELLVSGELPKDYVMMNCSESYRDALQRYCEATFIMDVLMRKMYVLVSGMDKSKQKIIKRYMPVLTEYMKKNLPVMLHKECCAVMTEEDLLTLSAIATSQEGVKASNANKDFANMMSPLFDKKAENEWVVEMRQNIDVFVFTHTKIVSR